MSESTQIRVHLEVKESIEEYQQAHNIKSHSLAINNMMGEIFDLKTKLKQKAADHQQYESKIKRDYIEVFPERRMYLETIQTRFNLKDHNQVLDLLFSHFEESDSVSMDTLTFALNRLR